MDQSDQVPGYQDGGLRTFCGVVLLLFGGVVMTLLLAIIHTSLTSNEENALVARLIPKDAAARSLVTPQQSIELPEGFFSIAAYSIFTMFLFVTAGIGNGLLRAGASLLHPDLLKLIDRFRRELRRSER